MSNFDEDDDRIKFSWVGLFSVTGFCCFLFGFFMKQIDETNIFPFFKIGFAALAIASVLYIHNYIKNRNTKKFRQKIQSALSED